MGLQAPSIGVMGMAAKKPKALQAAGRSDWAKSQFSSREHMEKVLKYLVWGCPIPGVSASGKNVPVFQNKDNAAAEAMLSKIFEGVSEGNIFHSTELRQVAKHLIDDERGGNKVPRGASEFFYFAESPTGVLKDYYGLYPLIKKIDLRVAQRKPYEKLLVLDALFRHLRNSIAHGAFSEVRRKASSGKKEEFLYLQDANSRGQITARMYLSYGRVLSICRLLDEMT